MHYALGIYVIYGPVRVRTSYTLDEIIVFLLIHPVHVFMSLLIHPVHVFKPIYLFTFHVFVQVGAGLQVLLLQVLVVYCYCYCYGCVFCVCCCHWSLKLAYSNLMYCCHQLPHNLNPQGDSLSGSYRGQSQRYRRTVSGAGGHRHTNL